MHLTIKKGMTKEEIDELLKQLPPSPKLPGMNKKPIDINKYKGKLSIQGDAVWIQRRIRDDRNYSY